jgi:hypothetical protein
VLQGAGPPRHTNVVPKIGRTSESSPRADRARRAIARALIAVLALGALATTLGGCGNDRSDKVLSSEEYAAAVTRICASNAGELRRLVLTSPGNFLARKGDKFVEVTNRNIGRLKRLRPPPELERKAGRLIVDAEAARDRLVVVVSVAKKHPGNLNLGNSALIDARRRMIRSASAVGATC